MANKVTTLENVRTKLESMYDSYNPKEFSSPDYEIPEQIAGEFVDFQKDYPYYDKVLSVVRYFNDDSIDELYFNGIGDGPNENLSQSDLEGIFQLILNK